MGLRIATITVSGVVTTIQDTEATELVFIISTTDRKDQPTTIMCKAYGKANKALVVQGDRVILCGVPALQNGAFYVNVKSVFNPNKDFNYALLGGTQGRDSETTETSGGLSLTKGSIAVDGDKKTTSWFNWVYFRDLLPWMNGALARGKNVFFSGSFNFGEYVGKSGKNEGKTVKTFDLAVDNLMFLPLKDSTAVDSSTVSGYPISDTPAGATPVTPAAADTWDEVPF